MFSLSALTVLVFAGWMLGQNAPSDEMELGTLADRVTHEIQSARKHDFLFPKILVIDFFNQDGTISAGGENLADILSSAFAERLGQQEVLSRTQLRERLLSSGISPLALRDDQFAQWAAGTVGANLIVSGHLRSFPEKMTISVELIRVSDAKRLSKASTDLQLTPQIKDSLDTPLDWPSSSEVVVPCTGTQRDGVVAAFRATGVTEPMCTRCPVPLYSDEARRSKFQGTVKLAVIVNERGRARSETIIKHDAYGLDLQAVDAVKEWEFKPATKDGKPVAVCVPIEVTFRLY